MFVGEVALQSYVVDYLVKTSWRDVRGGADQQVVRRLEVGQPAILERALQRLQDNVDAPVADFAIEPGRIHAVGFQPAHQRFVSSRFPRQPGVQPRRPEG